MVVGDVLLCVMCECLRVTLMWKWDGGTRQQLPCSEAAMQQRQAKPRLLVRTTDIYGSSNRQYLTADDMACKRLH